VPSVSPQHTTDHPEANATNTLADTLTFSESVHICLSYVWAGIRDASNWHASIKMIGRSRTLRVQTIKCFLLNGLIFLGSLYAFDLILKPSLAFFRWNGGKR
jgi:hypothetical protein